MKQRNFRLSVFGSIVTFPRWFWALAVLPFLSAGPHSSSAISRFCFVSHARHHDHGPMKNENVKELDYQSRVTYIKIEERKGLKGVRPFLTDKLLDSNM